MRCPVCRADNTAGPSCRRCRADLSLLFALEDERARSLAAARAAVARDDGSAAVAHAEAARQLRDGADVRRFLALGHLLRHDFAAVWQAHAIIHQG